MGQDGSPGFNVLWDSWLALEQKDGSVREASFRDLLTGVADGVDVWHPRDDMKVYMRVLLSALTQALFPAKTLDDLERRIAEPLSASEVDRVLERHRAEFELLGPGPRFLQGPTPPEAESSEETERLFPDLHALFKEPLPVHGLCARCMTAAVYGIQAFAPAGGRGYGQCVRGSSSITNLVVARESVRQDLWSSTLCEDWIQTSLEGAWAKPGGPWPWMPEAEPERPAHRVSLADALLWMPRRLWIEPLEPASKAVCALCARPSERLLRIAYFVAAGRIDGTVRHPHAPRRLNEKKKEWFSQQLRTGRPAWTGLAEMLMDKESSRVFEAAPVVRQWFQLNPGMQIHLLCWSTDFDNAKVRGRFSEQFTISMDRWKGREAHILDAMHSLVEQASDVLKAMMKALKRGSSKDSYWQQDAAARWWFETEVPFWHALEILEAVEPADHVIPWEKELRRISLQIFHEHTEAAILDNSQMSVIARAERTLRRDLNTILKATAPAKPKKGIPA